MPADANIRIFRLLRANYPEAREEYTDRLDHWYAAKLEGERRHLLPSLVGRGQFFLLFWHYFDTLEYWGLWTELDPEELHRRLDAEPEERKREIERWRHQDEVVPRPFVAQGDRSVVSSSFLVHGHYLFTPPNDEDPDLHHARQVFDKIAKHGLRQLFKEISSLRTVPQGVRGILQRHQESLGRLRVPV
jgi:hypothetical protein